MLLHSRRPADRSDDRRQPRRVLHDGRGLVRARLAQPVRHLQDRHRPARRDRELGPRDDGDRAAVDMAGPARERRRVCVRVRGARPGGRGVPYRDLHPELSRWGYACGCIVLCVCVLIVSAQYQVVLLYGTVYHYDDTLLTDYSCQMIEGLPSYEVPTIRHPPPAVRPVVHSCCMLPTLEGNKQGTSKRKSQCRKSHIVGSLCCARAYRRQEFERWKEVGTTTTTSRVMDGS